jgi:hypothetical protein
MASYLSRPCIKCGDHLGVVVLRPSAKSKEFSVAGLCTACGYSFRWKLFLGGKFYRPTSRVGIRAQR